MGEQNKISFIIYADDSAKLQKSIGSILGDGGNLQGRGEVIVAGTSELRQKLGSYAGSECVRFLETGAAREAEAYREGFQAAGGDYVCFFRSSSFLNSAFWKHAGKALKSKAVCGYDVIHMATNYINPKHEMLPYADFEFVPKNGVVNLKERPNAINLCLGSYLIKKSAVTEAFFERCLTDESLVWSLIELLEEKKEFYYYRDMQLSFYRAPETDSYNYQAQFTKDWYTKTVQQEWIPALQKHSDSSFVQYAVFYLLKIRYSCNWNDRNKSVIEGEEVTEFWEKTKEVLQYIDDTVITNYGVNDKQVMPRFAGFFFLKMKYGEEKGTVQTAANASFFFGMVNHEPVDSSSAVRASVQAINYAKNQLILDGKITNTYYIPEEELEVYVQTDSKAYLAKKSKAYSLDKFFNISVNRELTFTCALPEQEWKSGSRIWIYLKYRNFYYKLSFFFEKIQSRIVNRFTASYWRFGPYMLRYDMWQKCLVIQKPKFKKRLFQELHLYYQIGKEAASEPRARKALLLRMAYWLTKPFYKGKNIWMTFDQLFKGGDNGEYFFRYVSDRKDKGNIRIYYVLNKTAPEYKALHRKYGRKVLVFNSIRHKLISLHTDMIFATRVDVKLYCGFAQLLEPYFRGLFNGQIFCLQHGLTIQRIAQYQNRLFDNTRLYFCVSPYEKQNLSHPVYDYEDEVLVMTGAPRYDGLVSKDMKQILITPTWRRSVTAGTNSKGSMNEYSVNFKNTEYFKLYNSLINDEKLIASAKKNGYQLIYLIHPILSPQIQDYDTNEFVKIVPGSEVNYEKILSESSLMVTDYSGIQFDFAYMRKPLIYYHPDTLPPQYEAGGLQYDTMGFGPVCKRHEQIVDELCFYMDQKCQMTEMYQKRVDDFFAYDDRENCKRVYEATLEYMKKDSVVSG